MLGLTSSCLEGGDCYLEGGGDCQIAGGEGRRVQSRTLLTSDEE